MQSHWILAHSGRADDSKIAKIGAENQLSKKLLARLFEACHRFPTYELRKEEVNKVDSELIGEGGFGECFKGVFLESQVALKEIRVKSEDKEEKHKVLFHQYIAHFIANSFLMLVHLSTSSAFAAKYRSGKRFSTRTFSP